MRIDVSLPTWDAAALALSAGNQGAAQVCTTLGAAASSGGGMAGDDATSTDFAAAYDAAAQAALESLADLVDGYGTLSRLTRASLDHHRRADQASTLTCADRDVALFDPDRAVGAARLVTVTRHRVPSSRGGDAAQLGTHVQWVLDHVQGFCWPNADVDRLRTVGRAWAAAAGELDDLTRHAATAAGDLVTQTAPEIPAALAAIDNLDVTRSDLSRQLATIGRYCTTYADDVARHRAEIVDLVLDLLAGAVVVEGIGLVLGAVTAGLTTAGATALNASRIAATAPKILAVVEAQSALARLSAAGLDLARASLVTVTGALTRVNSARILSFAAHAVVGGAEVGIVNAAPLPPLPTSAIGPIDLCEEEGAGAHTVSKHVQQTDNDLRSRMPSRSGPDRTSTFPDLVAAEKAVTTVIKRHAAAIDRWASGSGFKLVLQTDLRYKIGRVMERNGKVSTTSGVTVVIFRDASRPRGWQIRTAYPDPASEGMS